MKKVFNEFGKIVIVDDTKRTIYNYNNSIEEIVYNAPIIENGAETGFFTNYVESGRIDSIEERLGSWNNKLKLLYAASVGFDKKKNDPDGQVYKNFLNYIKSNEEKFFDKNGDFRKKYLVSDAEILQTIRNE